MSDSLPNHSPNFQTPPDKGSWKGGEYPPPLKAAPVLPSLFWSCFFFLCCADLVFSSRIYGFNFRWGQILLLAMALWTLLDFFQNRKKIPEHWNQIKASGLVWIPFGVAYAIAVSISDFPALGLIKLGWAVFNIAGASCVLLNPRWAASLRRGFRWGILGLAGFISFQAFCLFDFQNFWNVTGSPIIFRSYQLTGHVFGFSLPLGIAQFSDTWQGHLIYRPCAFYYEPNYAACALAFSLPLLFWMENQSLLFYGWSPGLVMTAVVLTSSRGGILGCSLCLGILFCASFFTPFKNKRKVLLRSLLFAALGLIPILLSTQGRLYMSYLTGPLGIGTIQTNAHLPHTSEGDRVLSLQKGLQSFQEHPWLGQGYQPVAHYAGLVTGTLNTWVEIAMESGALGLLGFLFAVGSLCWRSLDFSQNPAGSLLACTSWIILWGINYNLATTFPRLDYWLLYFFSIHLLVHPNGEKKPETQ